MTLKNKYRPLIFDDVVGQDFAVSILRGIVRDPSTAPGTYLLSGAFGSGKTTLARILGRELNKVGPDRDIMRTPYYVEFDSAMVGNVDSVKSLRNDFHYTLPNHYRVIAFDECQLITGAAQSALLKEIEQGVPGVIFLFITTDPDRLLKTIISRSVEVPFYLVPDDEMRINLKRIILHEKVQISDEAIEVIIKRSSGHVRNSVGLLETFLLVGEDKFLMNVFSTENLYNRFFSIVRDKGITFGEDVLRNLMKTPLSFLRIDLEVLIMNAMNQFYIKNSGLFGGIDQKSILSFFAYYVRNKQFSFTSDRDFYSFMFNLAQYLSKTSSAVQAPEQRSRFTAR